MTIEELAKHYQETGEYLPEAKALEEEFVESHQLDFIQRFREYVNSPEFVLDDFKLSFDNFVDMEIGSWQAKHGFYRSFDEISIVCDECGKHIGFSKRKQYARCSDCSPTDND